MKFYDVIGKEVKLLVNENLSPGNYKVDFDGSGLPAGVYFYILSTEKFKQVKKMILLK